MAVYKRIGVLTSGGDAPGMNAATRAVVRLALVKGIEIMGIYNGYQGLIDGNIKPLGERDVSYIINRGGTMLYTARSDIFKERDGVLMAAEVCKKNGIEGVITIGGDGTFRGAVDLTDAGIPCIGIPATIDNDIASTESTVGFDTAMNTVVDLIDKLRDTGESHARCNVVEVMGREAGDIALQSALAVGAVAAFTKEIQVDFKKLYGKMTAARSKGKRNFIIVVCEGMGKEFSENLCGKIEENIGIVSRFSRLGHIQRGGSPTLRDRVIATQMGCAAVETLVGGEMKKVVCLRDNNIETMEIHEALLLDKMMKNTITEEELNSIPPNRLFGMKKLLVEKMAYKSYLNYLIENMAL